MIWLLQLSLRYVNCNWIVISRALESAQTLSFSSRQMLPGGRVIWRITQWIHQSCFRKVIHIWSKYIPFKPSNLTLPAKLCKPVKHYTNSDKQIKVTNTDNFHLNQNYFLYHNHPALEFFLSHELLCYNQSLQTSLKR